jgi:hypothetical protein
MSNFVKIRPVGAGLFHADAQRDGKTWRTNSRFSQFLELALKRIDITEFPVRQLQKYHTLWTFNIVAVWHLAVGLCSLVAVCFTEFFILQNWCVYVLSSLMNTFACKRPVKIEYRLYSTRPLYRKSTCEVFVYKQNVKCKPSSLPT